MLSVDEINKLKQENAELKAENATYKANADAVYKYITQNEQLKTHIDGLEKKNAALKAKNVRLKEEFKRLKESECIICKYSNIGNKYYQTLQEIKDIADARCDECKYGKDGISCKYGDCGEAKLHLITQLITKAESEG